MYHVCMCRALEVAVAVTKTRNRLIVMAGGGALLKTLPSLPREGTRVFPQTPGAILEQKLEVVGEEEIQPVDVVSVMK